MILGVLLFSGLWAVEAKADGDCKGYLTPYWTRNTSDGDKAGTFLMLGKEYTNGEFKNKYADDMVVLYNLDKNYSNVTFWAGALDGYSKDPADYKIYLDGELVQSFTREVNAAPLECSISTAGKTQMMVRIDAKTFSRWGIVNVTATGHQWELESQLAATADSAGSRQYRCKSCGATKTVTKSFKIALKNGMTFKKGKYTYKITSVSSKTVTLTKGDASLTSISVPAAVSCGGVNLKVTAVGSRAFYKGKATKAVVGSNVTSVGASAFESCTKLKSVKIGSRVSTIGSKAFYKCTALTKVTIPASVTKIGGSAFQSCTKLVDVILGKNVKTIGSKAFYGDKNLKTIEIRTAKLTTKTVGSSAFKNIYSKTKVTVPASAYAKYSTLLRSKGLGSKATVK